MEKPKKAKTRKTVQLQVMIDPEVNAMIRKDLQYKGDLGKRVEAAIRAMYGQET